MELDSFGRALTPEYLAVLEYGRKKSQYHRRVRKIRVTHPLPKREPVKPINLGNVLFLAELFRENLDPDCWTS